MTYLELLALWQASEKAMSFDLFALTYRVKIETPQKGDENV